MGKKKCYCPYCDCYLVHNSLRSRRDHASGWKHKSSFQNYYARFFQGSTSGLSALFEDETEGNLFEAFDLPTSTGQSANEPAQIASLQFPSVPPPMMPSIPAQVPAMPKVMPQMPAIPRVSPQIPALPKISPQIPTIPKIPPPVPRVPAMPRISMPNLPKMV